MTQSMTDTFNKIVDDSLERNPKILKWPGYRKKTMGGVPNFHNRRGKITVTLDFILISQAAAQLLFSRFIPLHIENNACTGQITYWGISADFDKVEDQYISPEYTPVFERDETGSISLMFHK